MFKTDSFLGNKKSSLNQNVWRDHATMQQDVLLYFRMIFLFWNQAEIWKKIFCCPALELFHCLSPLFHCLPPLFHCLPLWTTVRLHGKKYKMQQIFFNAKIPEIIVRFITATGAFCWTGNGNQYMLAISNSEKFVKTHESI